MAISAEPAKYFKELLDVDVPNPVDGYIPYYDAATGLWKCKAPTSAGLKVGFTSFTRAGDAGDGDVSYTGVGFKPKAVIIAGRWEFWTASSIGYSGGVNKNAAFTYDTDYYESFVVDKLIDLHGDGGDQYQKAVLKSFDADGFTLTWEGYGTNEALITFYALCLG